VSTAQEMSAVGRAAQLRFALQTIRAHGLHTSAAREMVLEALTAGTQGG
jgi:hypothetical protein